LVRTIKRYYRFPDFHCESTDHVTDKNGFVRYPNINIVEEMVDLVSAGRSYEANVTVIQSIKNMISKAFEIGR